MLGLAGATTVAGGEKTKETLGAISALILGGKAAFDKRALLENTMNVIIQKMRAERAKAYVDILRGLGADYPTYSTDAAALDLARYYYAGTVPAALTGLAATAVAEENQAKKEQKEVLTYKFRADKARTCLINFWKPGNPPTVAVGSGDQDPTHTADIKAWIAGSAYKGMMFGVFMNAAEAGQTRIDAVNGLVGLDKMAPCPM